jgi:uncharacterized protein
MTITGNEYGGRAMRIAVCFGQGGRLQSCRPVLICAAILLGFAAGHGRAQDSYGLKPYQCKTIVTGTDAERRVPNMIDCFKRTMTKASGDLRLLDDRTLNPSIEQVLAAVDKIDLKDRLWRRPIHDEQGTRDRPHDLTVDFKPAAIDAMLAKFGRKPWLGHRPATLVLLLVRHGDKPFILASDGDRGPGMTEAIADASERMGLPAIVPGQDDLKAASATTSAAAHPTSRLLDAIAKSAGAEAAVSGILTWSDEAFGWIAEWSLIQNGETKRWRTEGVNFDAAFRIGLGGAAQILSGNIQP